MSNDIEPIEDVEIALDLLSDYRGRTIVDVEKAVELMHPFYNTGLIEGDLLQDVTDASTQAHEMRAMTNAFPWEPLIGMCDITELLVEGIGEEPSSGLSAGTGSNADERHEGNLKTLREAVQAEA